jgi:cytidyltransferase-like protein
MWNRGLLFGSFDGIHEGHLYLLKMAKSQAQQLTVSLAPNEVIEELKGHAPIESFEQRSHALLATGLVDKVIASDTVAGSYKVVLAEDPDVIFFGYDQQALQSNFESFARSAGNRQDLVTIPPFKPSVFKSSLLNRYD